MCSDNCGGHQFPSCNKDCPYCREDCRLYLDEAEDLIGEAIRVAEFNRKGVGDLAHWSALNWEGHWRQRVGVEIMRGVARCVRRSADCSSMVASASSRRHEPEFDRNCC
eukprot:COSAG02_NODE_55_length_43887_cov_30.660364_21_plen_109_part_00